MTFFLKSLWKQLEPVFIKFQIFSGWFHLVWVSSFLVIIQLCTSSMKIQSREKIHTSLSSQPAFKDGDQVRLLRSSFRIRIKNLKNYFVISHGRCPYCTTKRSWRWPGTISLIFAGLKKQTKPFFSYFIGIVFTRLNVNTIYASMRTYPTPPKIDDVTEIPILSSLL